MFYFCILNLCFDFTKRDVYNKFIINFISCTDCICCTFHMNNIIIKYNLSVSVICGKYSSL